MSYNYIFSKMLFEDISLQKRTADICPQSSFCHRIYLAVWIFIDHTLDQLNRFLDSVTCTVNTQIIVDRITPFFTGVCMIITFMAFL